MFEPQQLVVAHATWAQSPLGGVNRGEVREWSRALLKVRGTHAKMLSSQSIKHALNLVRRVFAEALEDEPLETNPAQGVKPPRRADEQTDNWTSLTPRRDRMRDPLRCTDARTAHGVRARDLDRPSPG